MEPYEKKGFQKFRETKEAKPVGIALALLVSFALVVGLGFIGPLDGFIVVVFVYFILRLFRVRDIRLLLLVGLLLFIVLSIGLFSFVDFIDEDKNIVEYSLAQIMGRVLVTFILPYLLLSLLTWWMRRNLERTRARMEAEGRLYPQGYGRCKRCGALVLPGELMCRKCGEYVDVPEEMRVKKVNYFECSECGREVPKDAGVCPYCGEAFEDDEEPERPDGAQ
ncbi:MAG: zinc ribbon domain-containing protein [Methanomassiliicoccaceae archaeon]|jgi:RNA polymerase subunit RPABC4/transcription elongation factor Spt4|nr:zinc ribbon domain-containing protein [Methanomassiliicoccaceae archaeon]